MFKQSAIILGLGLFSLKVTAQAYEGKVKYGKTEEPAIIMVYNYPEEVVVNALNAKFADKRLKGHRNKGFLLYSNVVINEVSRNMLDYSFKIDESGKKGSEKTTVYMVMQGSGNIDDISSLSRNGKSFLEDMTADVKRSHNVMQIKKQEALLIEEETKLKELQNEQKGLEEKIEKNKARQQTQEKIIASQKMMLDDLKSKL
ncbi:MAG: hypothetical protein QM640_17530 [Niabella sp.]